VKPDRALREWDLNPDLVEFLLEAPANLSRRRPLFTGLDLDGQPDGDGV